MRKLCIILISSVLLFSSCKKSFLDKKPNESLVVPTTLTELQALLDNDYIMNGSSNGIFSGPNPLLLIIGSDDYYVPDAVYNGNFGTIERNVYTWERENVYSNISSLKDWDAPYKTVFYSNVVLDQLSKLDANNNEGLWNKIKGSALFYRAYAFFQLSQTFSPMYNNSTASSDLGIPLRLKADVSTLVDRSSVQQSYDQILNDLNTAKSLLSDTILPTSVLNKNRPTKPAVYGLLARVYLSMRNYDSAFYYSNACLQLYNSLLDYKTDVVNSSSTNPLFTRFNKEVIFQSLCAQEPLDQYLTSARTRVDTLLYDSYQNGDLRKIYFYRLREPGKYSFRLSYDGTGVPFMGLATDEIYLIRAECQARQNNVTNAMNDLNTLLQKRWSVAFVPVVAANQDDALNKILIERRKELVFRGLRWSDLRRLNKNGIPITLKRIVNGQTYILPANDLRYVWPIPDYVLSFNPGMQQNPR